VSRHRGPRDGRRHAHAGGGHRRTGRRPARGAHEDLACVGQNAAGWRALVVRDVAAGTGVHQDRVVPWLALGHRSGRQEPKRSRWPSRDPEPTTSPRLSLAAFPPHTIPSGPTSPSRPSTTNLPSLCWAPPPNNRRRPADPSSHTRNSLNTIATAGLPAPEARFVDVEPGGSLWLGCG